MPSSKMDRPPTPREDSVLVALGELARLEAERQDEERRAAEARRERAREEAAREAEARAERARREEAEAQRARAIAEAEARLRVEADVAQDARIQALRAELARVQAEREAMHRAAIERTQVTPSPSPRVWPLAFGLSSVVAAALAAMLVMQAQTPPRTVEVPVAAPSTAPAAPATPAPPAAVDPAREVAPRPVPVVTTPETAATARPPRRRGRSGDEPGGRPTQSPTSGDGIDFGGDADDVIGGLDRLDTGMAPVRRRR